MLGTERKMRGCGEKRKCVEVRDEMKYIPLLATIERLLHNKNVIKEVLYTYVLTSAKQKNFCNYRLKEVTRVKILL